MKKRKRFRFFFGKTIIFFPIFRKEKSETSKEGKKKEIGMAFTAQHRDWASTIAQYLSHKDSNDSTRISNMFTELWNTVGGQNTVVVIWFYVEQILKGINTYRAGPNLFNKGSIHTQKQKFINALYERLVRELVMPHIIAFMKSSVAAGAFVETLVVAEHVPQLQGVVVRDMSLAVEENLKNSTAKLKNQRGSATKIIAAIRTGNFNQYDISSEEDSSSSSDDLPAYHDGGAAARAAARLQAEADDEQQRINDNYLEAAQEQEFAVGAGKYDQKKRAAVRRVARKTVAGKAVQNKPVPPTPKKKLRSSGLRRPVEIDLVNDDDDEEYEDDAGDVDIDLVDEDYDELEAEFLTPVTTKTEKKRGRPPKASKKLDF